MQPVKITERGWIGHFICAERCRFRRNTLLECGRRRVIVSTVGAMTTPDPRKFDMVGCNRYYETAAFRAHREQRVYWEIATGKRVSFQSPWQISEIKEESDLRANEMHDAVVAELAGKLARGEKL